MQNVRDEFRLLIDPPLDGAVNMARDEALLSLAGRDSAPPLLRLYQWQAATLSLGYFQAFADVARQPSRIRDMPVVRRLTGGGAIVHEDELTYALVLPGGHHLAQSGPIPVYTIVHAAAIDMLASFGISARCLACNDREGARRGAFLCFDRRHALDVVVDLRKVLGSAQRRTHQAILQHGSLQRGPLRGCGRLPPHPADWAGPFADALAARLRARFTPIEWRADALQLAANLQPKYASSEWTQRR